VQTWSGVPLGNQVQRQRRPAINRAAIT
jgi:hypothetical protein